MPAGVEQERANKAAADARELIVFADGLEAVGYTDYARRCRTVARETIWLADMLAAEQSARVAMQEARDRAVGLLAERAGRAAA